MSRAGTRSVPCSFPRTGDMSCRAGGGAEGVNKKRVGDIGAVGPRRDAITTMGVGETHFHSLSMSYSHALGAILHRFYFTFSFS